MGAHGVLSRRALDTAPRNLSATICALSGALWSSTNWCTASTPSFGGAALAGAATLEVALGGGALGGGALGAADELAA